LYEPSEDSFMVKLARVRTMRLLASVAIGAMVVSFTPILGLGPHTAAMAQDGDSVSSEFRTALSPYGTWRRHPRWGEVWVYNEQTPDWRPYTRGRWLYTDEWGWYWDVGPEEYAWGWVAFHYGRWAFDPEFGWFWIPGGEWGPAWVDWRQGDDYVGWAPLAPEGIVYAEDPAYWCFVQPRFLLVPRVYAYFVPPRDRIVIIRKTVIVNRTVIVDRHRDRDRIHRRLGVNPGIDPRVVAKATGKPIRAAKVEPAVLRGTKVDGTREVDARAGRNAKAQIRETNNVIKPVGRIEPPKALGADEKGRLNRPLKAAQDTENDNRSGDNRGNRADDNRRDRAGDNRREGAVDNRRVNEQGNNLNLRPNDQSRNRGLADQDRNRRSNDQGRSPPPPPVNVIRGGVSDNDRRAFSPPPPRSTNERYNPIGRATPPTNERYNPVGRVSPPPPPAAMYRPPSPPPPVVRQPTPPQVTRPQAPPPQQVMRPQAPPQQQFSQPRQPQQQPQRGGGNNNRQNQQQQDPRLR
jgi:hypothetical protein